MRRLRSLLDALPRPVIPMPPAFPDLPAAEPEPVEMSSKADLISFFKGG